MILWMFAIGCFFGCWAFDDWCDAQIKIADKQLQQTIFQTFGKAYQALGVLK